jgi:short-subunit dehydrogenase
MGMGRLWCERFARDGANLVIWDINDDEMKRAAEDIGRSKVKVLTQKVDVSKNDAVYEAAEKATKEMGDVDILVNNAGIVFAGPFLETDDARLSAVIDVDLKAHMWTMKAFLPRMIERNSGHVVNVSSASGYIGVPRMPSYVAAKWGAIGLTESVRLELKTMGVDGVKFTLVCPSYVDTGMFEGAKPPLMTKMLKPKDIVDIAYEAFKQDKYIVNEPWLVKLTPALKGILPYQAFDLVSGILGVTKSMHKWRDLRH